MVKRALPFIALLVYFSSPLVNALTVTASVDKNPAIVDEAIVLSVIADDSLSADAFDASVLAKDFILGGTSVSSQTRMVNFKTTRTTQWSTLLVPRRAGMVTIPELNVNGAKTQAIALQVLPVSERDDSSQQDIFITAEVSKSEVYVQQQFTLTLRLHLATELLRGNLADPQMTGAEVIQIGDNKEDIDIINGKRYRIIEKTYAIKPQKSGEHVLHSTVFSGEVSVNSPQRRALFSSAALGKPVRVKGEEINITVKPAPSDFQGEWLPSELLLIEEQWPEQEQSYKVGEPITRTIKITAAALSAEQIPELEFNTPDGIKVYPDQAQTKSGINSGLLVSQKIQDFALVPTQAGEFELPAIDLPWWNTKLNRQEIASLPAKRIVVVGQPVATTPVTNVAVSTSAKEPVTAASSIWQWVFLSLWLITSFAWLYSAKLKGKWRSGKAPFTSPGTQYYLKLLAACRQNNGIEVLKLLPNWGNELFADQHFSNVEQLSQFLQNEQFEQQIMLLQRCYYGSSKQPWQGDELIKLISVINKQQEKTQRTAFALNPN
ncbi:BatD family protein [Thalassotalea ponticola]|uniref:BatD family protein n=1 Tax=Thalassotalea ponticola TaxID=1523392 RepID=UPI0025B4132C|nr:BatD family protein [Thalassotalea ponticola]MDN3651649.1 BatD family protein [Thalassotalea ponticola]